MRAWLCAVFIAALGVGSPAQAQECARLCTMWLAEPQCVDGGNGAYACDAMAKMTCGGYRWFCVAKSPVPMPYVEKFTWKQPSSFTAPVSTADRAPEGAKPFMLNPAKRSP